VPLEGKTELKKTIEKVQLHIYRKQNTTQKPIDIYADSSPLLPSTESCINKPGTNKQVKRPKMVRRNNVTFVLPLADALIQSFWFNRTKEPHMPLIHPMK
jgi:hypothetical protein